MKKTQNSKKGNYDEIALIVIMTILQQALNFWLEKQGNKSMLWKNLYTHKINLFSASTPMGQPKYALPVSKRIYRLTVHRRKAAL